MSERGSFTTNYIYNEHDYQSVKNALDINDKYLCVAPPATWSNGCETFEMPIVQGKVGSSIPNGEYLTIIDNLQGIQTITTIIIIVVQESGNIIRLEKHPFGDIDIWMLKPVDEQKKCTNEVKL